MLLRREAAILICSRHGLNQGCRGGAEDSGIAASAFAFCSGRGEGARVYGKQGRFSRRSVFLCLAGAQLLYDGGKSSGLARAAGEGVKGAESSREAVSADVRFALRSAFTSLLKAQEYVTLAADIQGRRLRNVRLIGLRYRAGREHIGSLRKAEADLADAEFEVARASRGLGVSRSALSTAMGRASAVPILRCAVRSLLWSQQNSVLIS